MHWHFESRLADSVLATGVVLLMSVQSLHAQSPATRPVIPDRTEKLPQEIDGLAVVEQVNSKLPFDNCDLRTSSTSPSRSGLTSPAAGPVILNLGY